MTYWITELIDKEGSNKEALYLMNKTAVESAKRLEFIPIHYERYEGLANQGERRRIIIETLLNAVQPGDTIVVQYPLYITNINFLSEFIDYLKNDRKAKIVALVHDIYPYMYGEDFDPKTDFWLNQLRKQDLLLVANEKVANRLYSDEVLVPMIDMKLHDYIYEGNIREEKKYIKELHYASGRQIVQLDYLGQTPLHIYGWGPGLDLDSYPTVDYKGSLPSDELMISLESGFGLVNSFEIIEKSNPGWREYSKWNNPTKLSLYLAAGIPVVVHAESPHAELIKKYNIGLVLNHLNDIDQVLSEMTEENYQQMIKNVKPWSKAIRNGYFMKRSFRLVKEYLELGFDEGLIKFD